MNCPCWPESNRRPNETASDLKADALTTELTIQNLYMAPPWDACTHTHVHTYTHLGLHKLKKKKKVEPLGLTEKYLQRSTLNNLVLAG
jgi:hypothetical protein